MQKYLLFLCLFFSMSISFASRIQHLVFLGDSYMDDGNLYKLTLHVLPKSPPYYEGRFSNGTTWAERVGHYYEKHYRLDYKIYAVGGATTIFHWPTPKFFAPTTLYLETEKYLFDTASQDKSSTLFIIWIGDNDYMFDQDAEPNAVTDKVVNTLSDTVKRLTDCGARRFMIFNLIDTTKTPLMLAEHSPRKLRRLVDLHNAKLATAVERLRKYTHGMKISYFDVHTFFDDVLAQPEKFNQLYHTNITNTTKACWEGGLTFRKLTEQDVATQLTRELANKNPAELAAMNQFILNTPPMTQLFYDNYSALASPCAHPEQYIFWDNMHPTATVHELLAQAVQAQLNNEMDWPTKPNLSGDDA